MFCIKAIKSGCHVCYLPIHRFNAVAKAYISDANFGGLGGELSMWNFYNLLTGSNKSSYIDSFLDRTYNATELATGINAALHGDERYRWFID